MTEKTEADFYHEIDRLRGRLSQLEAINNKLQLENLQLHEENAELQAALKNRVC